ncbi:hypothetical protein ORJ66_11060 [Pseudoalteromonas tunicata]|uniref:PssD/Cps14F family polysaccharide biosynthesis glycosyltransferase n=1 Tax=Pseudoalteromonas tunicata TaxID=314281 RepID=UPI00273E4CAF|nr:PssD/Cps14F family polysaccharide biosynthesis glycosyltransferase [Pseudoalteromonas tunicata]MDP5213581.1 hypothetical protein [Pseudoalteromonas tunicata]
MKDKVVLLIFGEGGHHKEMMLFLDSLPLNHSLTFISIGPDILSPDIEHFYTKDVRDKHSRFKSILKASIGLVKINFLMLKLLTRYKLNGAVSTGPGVALIPFLMLKLLGRKTVFIETFCRFYTRSFTGKIMYKLADRFLVQNKELTALYPNAEYCGRL